jgi:hypothetical protein
MKTISPVIVAIAVVLSIVGVGLAQQGCKSTVVGDLRIEQVQSRIFDRMITVRIWLPPGYNDASQGDFLFSYFFDTQVSLFTRFCLYLVQK